MKKINLNEGSQQDLPVIARKKGQAGIVFINKKTGKPDPTSYMSAAEVAKLSKQDQEKIEKYIDPDKFAAVEKRNKERLAQIEAEKQRLKGVGNPPSSGGSGGANRTPASSGSGSRPSATAPARPAATTPAPSAPAPAAPKPSPVAAYMAAAAKARKSGDPAEMAKVRDMGMEIWRKSNPKLAAAAAERSRIRGTAQTDNPLMKDMRSRLPVTPTVQAPAVKSLGLGQQSLVQNPYAGRSPEPAQPKFALSKNATMNKAAQNLSKSPLKKEAYDIVLDYLITEGHAETISEAHYVMLQMDAEHIRNIVNEEFLDF